MANNYPAKGRVRAYGKARIELAEQANRARDWKHIWKAPMHPYAFHLASDWKQCVEYQVEDFPAEVGFMIDVLGLEVNALDNGYAQFSSPQGDFFFAIVPTPPGRTSTHPDALRIQFMVTDILEVASELESRGIQFELLPQPCQPGSSLYIGYFRTPHGIPIEIWGRMDRTTPLGFQSHSNKPSVDQSQELEDLTDSEQEEEFFPGLFDVQTKGNAVEQSPRKKDTSLSAARHSNQITDIQNHSAPAEILDDEDEYLQLENDENDEIQADDGIQYVDDIDDT